KALETRAAREAAYTRNTVLLGTISLVLLAGLVGAGVMVLRLTGELREQRAVMKKTAAMTESLAMPGIDRSREEGVVATARMEPTMLEESVAADELETEPDSD